MSEEAERLYERARALEPGTRGAFVEAACRGDPRLREELVSLLEQAEAAEEFFDLLGGAIFPISTPPEEQPDGTSYQVPTDPTWPTPRIELPIGTTIGRYRIVSLIGSGGMGVVYRAYDGSLNRDVALKFLPPLSTRLDDESRLLGEARAAAALEHPNVCTVHEIGQTEDGRPFIAMALCEGETLKERLRQGPMPVEEAVATAVQIARGLAVAHARGIVHRDVKPGNVILGDDGTVRLLDFGIAQVADSTLTPSGTTPGTVAYMSPEQVRGDAVDSRTDLWSLGVVLYEMLTGVRPFGGEDDRTLLAAILHTDPEPVSRRRPEVSPPLARVVERFLRKDPDVRYGSAAQVQTDLTQALSPTEGLSRRPVFMRRRAALLAGSATALVMLVGALWLPERRGASVSAVGARGRVSSPAAYELYLRGNDPTLPRSESGVRESLEYFKRAIAADSTYAAAYAGLALAYVRLDNWFSPGRPIHELHELAADAAEMAVALDDSLAEAHQALARVRMAQLDFASAQAEIRRAIALDPTDVRSRKTLAWLHIWAERPREALAEARRALEDDLLSPYSNVEVAHALFVNRRYDEALAQLDRITAIRPPLQSAVLLAGQCYAAKGMWPEAVAALRPQAQAGGPRTLSFLGYTLARAGQREEASRILADLLALQQNAEVGAFEVAVVYAGLGDLDQAIAWLDKSIDDQSLRVQIMEPTFENLRRDPRFELLKARLGLQKL